MSHSLSMPSSGRWRAAPAIAVTALLAFAASANAAVYTPSNGVQFKQATVDANANPGHDTIIMPNILMTPVLPFVITDDLTITGDHAHQFGSTGDGPGIDGNFIAPADSDTFTVNSGVTLRLAGFNVQQSSQANGTPFMVRGTLIMDNMLLQTNGGSRTFELVTGSSTTVRNSTIADNNGVGFFGGGALTLINSDLLGSVGGGIDMPSVTLRNSILNNQITDCYKPAGVVQSNSLDNDGSCGSAASEFVLMTPYSQDSGGPTLNWIPPADSAAIGGGDPAFCPTTDQRFFVRAGGACDIGSFQSGATQDTTAPNCGDVTVITGAVKQQQVTLRDGGSGLGHDAVRPEDVTITNGTVAIPSLASPFRSPVSAPPPSNNGLTLTASKTNQTMSTKWSFTGRDWAGNVRTAITTCP